MEISQIKENDRIILLISTADGKSASLESHARNFVSSGLLVDPFTMNDTIIGFNNKNLNIDMLVVEDDQTPLLFKEVKVQKVTYDDAPYHLIIAPAAGTRMNRRAHYRLFLGEDAQISVGLSKPVTGIIKDLSVGGFAVVISAHNTFEVTKHTRIQVSFTDQKSNMSFNLIGHIVRMVNQDANHTILYGCILEHENNAIARFVNARQLELRNLNKPHPPRK